MKNNLRLLRLFLLTAAFISTIIFSSVNAGGPLIVKDGIGISYGSRPFLYRYDQGPLGMFSNSEAVTIIESLFMDWEGVKTAKIDFKQDNPGFLSSDITQNNFSPILDPPSLLGYTPIVFDTDGSIVDAFIGTGSNNSVLGFAGPVTVNSGPLANLIAESQAVFNGRFVNGISNSSDRETSVDAFKGTVIHEVGHGIGLDHSQINVEAINMGASQEIRDSVPLEFPVAVNDLFLIRRDDASSLSLLYPNNTELANFGKIEGKVFKQDAMTPVLGANVIARNINNSKLEAISCVSDFLKTNTGSFTLFALPPGNYKVELEPIDVSFTGGSGVGPYSMDAGDISFQAPVPKGFYTGSNLPITSDGSKALVLNVQAGQTLSNINIVAALQVDSSSSGDIIDIGSSSSGDIIDIGSSSGDIDIGSSSSGSTSTSTSGGIISMGTSSGVVSTPTSSSSSGGISVSSPELEIVGPTIFVLKQKGKNIVKLNVTSVNFKLPTQCQVFTSDDSLIMVKPLTFNLSAFLRQQILRVTIPKKIASDLIKAKTSKEVTINVTCKNGTSDEFDLNITP